MAHARAGLLVRGSGWSGRVLGVPPVVPFVISAHPAGIDPGGALVIEQIYRYDHASALRGAPTAPTLALASDRSAPVDTAFLKARAVDPQVTAKALRAVSEIVGSRFYIPPSMLAKILREADPVVTVGADAVRFEGFSACCSAYARLDLDDGALKVDARRKGTTNVDFGPELRGALASVTRTTDLGITVGADAVAIDKDGAAIVEKKVPLPLRWVKGFAEVQGAIAGMEPAFSVPRVAAQRFLRGLPRGKNDQRVWVSAAGPTVRMAARESAGAVPLRGSHRLRVFEALAGLAERLDVHLNRATGATSWALSFGAQRLWLVLNAEPWRGFSGDGGLLRHLAGDDGSGLAEVAAHLNWQDRIDPADLARKTGLSAAQVAAALARLAAAGRVGFDLTRAGYFHRDLPFSLGEAERQNPRLKAARALFDSGAVRLMGDRAEVVSGDVTHAVRRSDDGWRCTCPWFAKNGSRRGPCKHMLAVELELDRTP